MDDTDASDEEARTQAASVDERARDSGAATRPGARPPRAELGRGALLGRYVILERLGAGGMGVVHAAYDPELDRKVAIKLLHSGRGGRAASERAAEPAGDPRRLEAQALARLSHPNVVAVHDVGTFDGQVFVAMELIEARPSAPGWRARRGASRRSSTSSSPPAAASRRPTPPA
ncbi:MAG: hypothetical protein H6710_21980 [Myxococcales bacterium]|nr:hypothetical protein [Myxococcales bacterium]